MNPSRVNNLILKKCLRLCVQNYVCASSSAARHTAAVAADNGDKPTKNGFKSSKKMWKGVEDLTIPPPALIGSAVSKSEIMEFTKVFPDLVRVLTETPPESIGSPSPPANRQHFGKALQHNVASGKKNRGLGTVLSYKMLAPPEEQTPENLFLARIMGWCLEFFHASLLVVQDTVDQSHIRRNGPSWYLKLKEDFGPLATAAAFNDAGLIKSGVYQILKTHFSNKSYYTDVMELFLEMSQRYNLGQSLDLEARADHTLSMHTMERYMTIVRNKTAHHSFRAPVCLALFMCGNKDPETHRQVKTIQMEMAQFFQVQNNFLDCFGNPKALGRLGTDIEDGKITWLSVVACQRASPQQMETLQDCYGKNNAEKVAVVKELYNTLELPFMYKIYGDQCYDLICTQVQQNTKNLPHKLFLKFLEKIFVKI